MRKNIFLSGPVERSDNSEQWREEMKEKWGYYNFYDPNELNWSDAAMQKVKEGDEFDKLPMYYADYETAFECFRLIMLSDGLFIRWAEEEVTWGTPIEQFFAWQLGKPVVVCTEGNDVYCPMYLCMFTDSFVENRGEGLKKLEDMMH